MPKKKSHRVAKGEGSLYQRGRMWWYKSADGHSFSTGTSIQSEAIDFKIRKLAEFRIGMPSQSVAKPPRTTVNELLDAHVAYMRRKNRKSTQDVSWVLDLHVRPYFGHRVAATLTTRDFEQYREDKKNDLEPTTINRHMSYLRSGYYTGMKRVTPQMVNFIPAFPTVDESYNVRQGFLTIDGYQEVLDKLPVSLKPLFICGFHVSSRKGELKNILWSQVDMDEGLIVMEPATAKNKAGRALPIYGDMVEALAKQKQIRDELFPHCEHVFFWHAEDAMIGNGGERTKPGNPIRTFRKSWVNAVKAAGYPGLMFHDLRRTAERNMTKAGIEQSMRMKISGHKTDSMSRRYNIVVAADVADQKKKMDEWFRKEREKAETKAS